jgi:hypothetical protein
MREQHPARAVMVQYRAMARKHSFVLAPLLLPIVLGFLTQIYAQEKPPQEVLTNDAIVRMVQAHLGVDVIVEQIRNSPGNYSLNSSSLIILKQQGVPDAVISAMQATKRGEVQSAPTKAPSGGVREAESNAVKVTSSGWHVDNPADPLTGKRHVEGFMLQPIDGSQQKGKLGVTATCEVDMLKFQIAFISDPPGVGLKRNVTGGFGHTKPWVEMRVKIDDQQPVVVTSEEDFRNYASVFFLGGAYGPNRFLAFRSAGTIAKAIQAHSILVELTTENGAKELLKINPQEPSFKEFTSTCPWGAAKEKQVTETLPPAEDGFKSLVALPWSDRGYKGTVDGFAAALRGFVSRAASVGGLAPRDYESEIAHIDKAVRKCAEIIPSLDAPLSRGSEYQFCDGKLHTVQQEGVHDPTKERRLGFLVRPRDGKALVVDVYFEQKAGDPQDTRSVLVSGYNRGIYYQQYAIMDAIIDPPPPTDGFLGLSAIPTAKRSYEGNVSTFLAQIPSYVNQAMAASGLTSRDFRKEIDYVVAEVRTCARYPGGRAFNDPQYARCNGTNHNVPGQETSGAGKQRGFFLSVSKPEGSGGWYYVNVKLAFAPLNSDTENWTIDRYTIVDAHVRIR